MDIADIPADDESSTSSDSSSDDEKKSREISTVETIIVEKSHSQVSTSITEITTNTHNYPVNDPNYPAMSPNYPLGSSSDVPDGAPILEEIPIIENAPKPVEDVQPMENILKSVYTPSFAEYPMPEDFTTTVDDESQTEARDVCSETTQTDEKVDKDVGTTRDAYSMTAPRSLSDSEVQTQIVQGSASTQTDYEDDDSQWYRHTSTVEEVRESSLIVTSERRQCCDSETQTDDKVDDDEQVFAKNHEGTQTEPGRYRNENEITRIIRRTSTETTSESTYSEKTEFFPPKKADCPVCLQSLEATNYSFIKVKDLAQFTAMEERCTQYEMEDTSQTRFCFNCGKNCTSREEDGYSSTMAAEQGEEGSAGGSYAYSNTSGGNLGEELGEGSGFSSTTTYEEGQEKHGYPSTTRKEWSEKRSTRETSEYSSTTTSEEWQKDVVIDPESSEAPEGAHFSIRIDGDEKCLLYCRRTGNHACALQKLASIIKAQRQATISSSEAACEMQAHSSGADQDTEIPESAKRGREESGEDEEAGTSDATGPQRCDVSVQTDSALLPADFEVFNDKDFEIYYDEQKSPRWTAMTIAQGMQKEHESLMKQLDMLREVNQKLRDQKDAIEAAHEAQSSKYMCLRDELALAQTLEHSPVKQHKVVTRQGSEMSKYFGTFEGMKHDSTLESVTENNEQSFSSSSTKRKLMRTKTSVQSIQPPGSGQDILEYAGFADGAEFEGEQVFADGELKESERPEWMEQVHNVMQPIMSKAEKQKTEQEFRKHKANISSQVILENGHHQLPQVTDSVDGEKEIIPLSPVRRSPVGTETKMPTEQKNSLSPESASNIQRIYKVVFVGDSGVGKSSFIHRYCFELWKPSYTATIGVDFQVKSLQLGLKKLALQLWDTAGQERFRSITKQYFRKADGVVLLYDLSSVSSFINIKSWMTSVEEAAEPGCTVMLIGNKLDLCEEDQKCRAVSYKDGEELAQEYGCLYAEASAKSGENVNEAMETLARRLQEQEDWQLHSVLNLQVDVEKKKSKCCGR
ncbi:uncharacterized protein LOC114518127 isoform X2 [Dendronephthya gigantea]|uniref:uncharacterized protein LOC114518127 isoform X2 n=1 Tax=Dendronephthya gigantea TaxID=151771 RepID=UPI001069B579|nr:uncharacterized protein LOC114518127 isoform X2 [Dendronephthya gigantea]